MLKPLLSAILGTLVALAPCASGEPAERPAPPADEPQDATPQKRRGFLSLFKTKEKEPRVESGSEEDGGKAKALLPWNLSLDWGDEEAPGSAGAGDSSARRRATYVTTKDRVPFYRDGPIQPGGPDRLLAEKQLVTLVREHRGWTDVRLENGEVGTVASEEIRKAKASDFPAPTVKKKTVEPTKQVVVFESVAAPPLPELEAFDLGELGGDAPFDISDNPLLFPVAPPDDPAPE